MTRLASRPLPGGADGADPLPTPDPAWALPILILFPHSRCNCRCLMCDIWKERRTEVVGAAEVERWREEWRALGVTRVVLSGGEALLNAELRDLCGLLGEAEMGITLLTSGLLLARNAEWVARLVDDVVVSLDGPRAVHDAIRNVPDAFERLAEGVRAVREAGPAGTITGRCTVQRRNALRLRETVEAAREIGLDRISFLAVDVSSSAFNRPDGAGATPPGELALSREELPLLAAELDALERERADDLASGFVAESAPKLRTRLLGHFAAAAGEGPWPGNRCNAPWVSAVVEADGTVRPCFFQPAVGNLREAGGLRAVLGSEEARRFRATLDVGTDPVCLRCVCSLALR